MRNFSELIKEGGRIFRFGIVGIVATGVYAVATTLAVEWLRLPPVAASIFGQLVAAAVSYFGHILYSFRVKMDHQTYLWRFLVAAATTLVLNWAVTWFLTNVMEVSYRIAVAVMMVMIPTLNYLFNRFWVFLPGLVSAMGPRGSTRS